MKKLLIILAAAIIAGSSMSAFAAEELYYYEFVTTCGRSYSYSSPVELTSTRLLEEWDKYEAKCNNSIAGVHDVKALL